MFPNVKHCFPLHTLLDTVMMIIIVVMIDEQPTKTNDKAKNSWAEHALASTLLDVLGDPLESVSIAHLADNTAHENFKWTDIRVTKVDLPLPGCEVAKA